jgi:hypothetical protein
VCGFGKPVLSSVPSYRGRNDLYLLKKSCVEQRKRIDYSQQSPVYLEPPHPTITSAAAAALRPVISNRTGGTRSRALEREEISQRSTSESTPPFGCALLRRVGTAVNLSSSPDGGWFETQLRVHVSQRSPGWVLTAWRGASPLSHALVCPGGPTPSQTQTSGQLRWWW